MMNHNKTTPNSAYYGIARVVVCAFVLLIILMCGTASAAWANTSYTHAKNITLLGADTELTNYPYLVSIAKESAASRQ